MIARRDFFAPARPLERASAPAALSDADVASRELARILDERDLRVVFQPVVDLDTGEVVALEALACGTVGTGFEASSDLFAAARLAGRMAELDWACRAVAFSLALGAHLPPTVALFVTVEPEAISARCPADLVHVFAEAEGALHIIYGVPDRTLVADPAGVLRAADHARELGWGVAIDDVGSSRAPVALLPIFRADVIKLDLRHLRDVGPVESGAIVTSVLRHVEVTGATLVVDGIESEADAAWARALGATLGKGTLLGAPGPLRERYGSPHASIALLAAPSARIDVASPFELFVGRPLRTMGRPSLDRLALVLALSPRPPGTWPVILVDVGRDGTVPDLIVEHGVPERTLLFVTFGTDLTREPVPGVLGVRLALDDPLADERFLIVLSDQAPVGIFARKSPAGYFDVVVSQDETLVYAIAHQLLRRVPGPGRNNYALAATSVGAVASAPAVPPSSGRRWHRRRGATAESS